jgi:hypothetical protein
MSATVAPATADRSDFRTVLTSGTKVGLVTAAAVVLYLLVAKHVPAGSVRGGLETLLVLAAGTAAAFLPGRWSAARSVEGIAGAAAIGLWGTLVFSGVDIVLLRPMKAYPWTWDAVGGGSTWWYLPIWWMLGTFLAWMGGVLTAAEAARGRSSLARTAAPVLIGAVVLAAAARFAGLHAVLPVEAGAGFAVTLPVLVVLALALKV